MKKTIFFVRHGQTDYNLNKIIQGSGVDSSLNKTGQRQAALFFKKYKKEDFDLVITSALKRTQETMSQFLALGITHEITPDINEINWGIHEGQKYDDWMKKGYEKLLGAWSNDDLEASLEKGESAKSLINRCEKFLDYLWTLEQKRILVCTHGRTLRCLVMLMKEQHPREMEKVEHANTGVYVTYLEGEKFEFLKENSTAHLESMKK